MAEDRARDAKGRLFAGVELGGTKCICILASGPDAVIAQQSLPTADPVSTLAAIEAVLDGWRADHDIAALGVASFGPLELDPERPDFGFITASTKPGWRDVDLGRRLAARYRLPMGIDTDVGGAALAEGRWGASRGLAVHAYVTVGTGIGVGIVAFGRPLRSLGHGEAGHMRVARLAGDDWPGMCPYHGDCAEGLASGPAIAARAGRPAATLAPHDPVWDGVTHALSGMLHNLTVTLAPSRIVIGGGVAIGQPHLVARIRQRLVVSLADYGEAKRIARDIDDFVVAPSLAARAGPLGAIAIASDAYFATTL